MKILVLEDNERLANLIVEALEQKNTMSTFSWMVKQLLMQLTMVMTALS